MKNLISNNSKRIWGFRIGTSRSQTASDRRLFDNVKLLYSFLEGLLSKMKDKM